MDRRPYQAKLTREAADAWDRFLLDEGRTFTAVVEALGLEMAAGRTPIPKRVLDKARDIDVERRSRRR